VASRKLLATLDGHSGLVNAVAFSPDGKTLASGSSDNLLKLWDVASRKLLATLDGHGSWVSAVAFSPDGKTLVSGSGDNTLKLWDVASRKPLATLEGHSSAVTTVAFSPDGTTLVSGSGDNTIIQWDSKSGEIITRTVLLPGNQWLVYHPRKLAYDSSYPETQEEKYAAIRFDGQLRPVYPLEYYRKELKRETGLLAALQASQPVIEPKWFRLWWNTSENRGVWFTTLVFAVVIGFVVFDAWRRRSDPLEIAKEFFEQTGAQITESLRGHGILLQSPGNQTADLVALWPEAQDNPQALVTAIVEKYRAKLQGRAKLYLVYKERGPEGAALQTLRAKTGCDIIPLFSTMLEQALLAGDSPRVLRDLEEPYLVRTDPYAESKPVLDPQWFYGRGELLQRLPAVLAQGQHVGLFGLRKVGKTSLINQLRQRFVNTPTVFIDCQAMPNKAESYFDEIFQQLYKSLTSHRVKDLPPPPATVDADQFRRQFLSYFEAWQAAGRREPFLLIFDEIDKFFPRRDAKDSEEILAEYVRCFRILRGLAQTRQCLVMLAVAYRPDVNRHNQLSDRIGENPMFRSFQEEYLGFLNADDSSAMIEEIGTWKDIDWTHEAARRVFDYCGGHPLITRLFASEACEEGSRKQIDLVRVEEVASAAQKTFRKNDIGNYYQEGVWDLLRNEERNVLNTLCRNGTDGIPESEFSGEQGEEALSSLEHFGLVSSTDGKLHLTSALFRTWVQRRLGT
jgi:hypothetical protein